MISAYVNAFNLDLSFLLALIKSCFASPTLLNAELV